MNDEHRPSALFELGGIKELLGKARAEEAKICKLAFTKKTCCKYHLTCRLQQSTFPKQSGGFGG